MEIYDANFQFNTIYIQRSNRTDCAEPAFSNERHSSNLRYFVNINVIAFFNKAGPGVRKLIITTFSTFLFN